VTSASCSERVRPNGHDRRQGFLASAVPPSARRSVARAFAGSASPRQAIKAKCLDCCGYDRAEVAGCTVIVCPLHSYRPFQENRRNGQKTARGNDISDGTAPGDTPTQSESQDIVATGPKTPGSGMCPVV
jgi:hypothetical protein